VILLRGPLTKGQGIEQSLQESWVEGRPALIRMVNFSAITSFTIEEFSTNCEAFYFIGNDGSICGGGPAGYGLNKSFWVRLKKWIFLKVPEIYGGLVWRRWKLENDSKGFLRVCLKKWIGGAGVDAEGIREMAPKGLTGARRMAGVKPPEKRDGMLRLKKCFFLKVLEIYGGLVWRSFNFRITVRLLGARYTKKSILQSCYQSANKLMFEKIKSGFLKFRIMVRLVLWV